MVSRAVGRLVDPSTLLQTLQLELLKGELLDGVEHLEGYGRTAHPPAGFEALTASLGGNRAHTVALAAFHRQYRPKNLQPGEQAIYDDQGQVIALLRDRLLYIYGCDTLRVEAETSVRIETPLLECTGEIRDRCDSGGVTMADMRQIYNGHTHHDLDGTTYQPNQPM
jgi:phage baseplate assembly protein V